MKRVVALIGLYFFSLFLISCGGGSSGDSGVDFSVSFGTVEGSTDVGPGSIRTLVATVLQKDGTPADGLDVKFSFHQNESGGSLEKISSKTQANGEATAIYRAGINPGTDVVQVKAKGARAAITMKVAGGGEIVSSIILTADPDRVDVGGYSTIKVEGFTFDNLPASGSQVDFSFLLNNSGARFIDDVGQEVEELTRFLDLQGKTSVTYLAGDVFGEDIVKADLPIVDISETVSLFVGPVDSEPPVITSTTLPSGIQNTSYGFQLRASNGIQPYTWQIINGSLPPGLSLNSTTGLISGIPSSTGWFSFNVEVQDAIGLKGLASLSLEIKPQVVEPLPDPEPPVITSTTLPSGVQNSSYGFLLLAEGGTQPYTWRITSGELPEGLDLDTSTGLISGVPTQSGWFSFNVEARDAKGLRGYASLALEIKWDEYSLNITSGHDLEPAIENTFYTEVLEAEGGRRPYLWQIISGALPDGLDPDDQFQDQGIISGMPTKPGQFNFVVMVRDVDQAEHYKRMRIVVSSADLVITTTSPLPDATIGEPYEYLLTATWKGQTGGFTTSGWSVLDSIVPGDPYDTIPDGLVLQDDGLIRGVPTFDNPPGTYSFMVRIGDDTTQSYKRFDMEVLPPLP